MQGDDTGERPEDFRDGMPFLGGSIWLDLLNSTPAFPTGQADFLATPERVAAWLTAAGLTPRREDGDGAALRALRGTLGEAFAAMAAGEAPADRVLAEINDLLAEQERWLRLERDGASLALMEVVRPGPGGNAAAIAEDFARFLADHEASRLKCCANPACNLVFYDRGKSRRRRWCSMSACGNRDKVARYRRRHGEG